MLSEEVKLIDLPVKMSIACRHDSHLSDQIRDEDPIKSLVRMRSRNELVR